MDFDDFAYAEDTDYDRHGRPTERHTGYGSYGSGGLDDRILDRGRGNYPTYSDYNRNATPTAGGSRQGRYAESSFGEREFRRPNAPRRSHSILDGDEGWRDFLTGSESRMDALVFDKPRGAPALQGLGRRVPGADDDLFMSGALGPREGSYLDRPNPPGRYAAWRDSAYYGNALGDRNGHGGLRGGYASGSGTAYLQGRSAGGRDYDDSPGGRGYDLRSGSHRGGRRSGGAGRDGDNERARSYYGDGGARSDDYPYYGGNYGGRRWF